MTARLVGPGGEIDVSDQADRQLGIVTVADLPNTTATGELPVADDYEGGEVLPEQVGPAGGGVLDFAFATPVQLLLIELDGADADVGRIDPFGGIPTAGRGVRARDATPVYLPVTTALVRVWTPAGAAVAVTGFRRL